VWHSSRPRRRTTAWPCSSPRPRQSPPWFLASAPTTTAMSSPSTTLEPLQLSLLPAARHVEPLLLHRATATHHREAMDLWCHCSGARCSCRTSQGTFLGGATFCSEPRIPHFCQGRTLEPVDVDPDVDTTPISLSCSIMLDMCTLDHTCYMMIYVCLSLPVSCLRAGLFLNTSSPLSCAMVMCHSTCGCVVDSFVCVSVVTCEPSLRASRGNGSALDHLIVGLSCRDRDVEHNTFHCV
jgi:hypothetical protein